MQKEPTIEQIREKAAKGTTSPLPLTRREKNKVRKAEEIAKGGPEKSRRRHRKVRRPPA